MGPLSTGRRPSPIGPARTAGERERVPENVVTLYTMQGCRWCDKAKALLRHRAIPFKEIDVGRDRLARAELARMSGGQPTVPQIFIGGEHLGGYTELAEIDVSGRLRSLVENATLALTLPPKHPGAVLPREDVTTFSSRPPHHRREQ